MSPSLSARLPLELSPDAVAATGAGRPSRQTANAGRADGLSAGQQRAVIGAIVVLHAGLGYALLQVQAVREAVVDVAPIFVDLLTPPPLPAPPVPPVPPVQPVQPVPLPQHVVQQPKMPPPAPVIAAAPSPAPAAFSAPPPPAVAEPAAPIAAPPVEVAVSAPPAPPAPPAPTPAPPPKMIPPSAVQYLEQVLPVYSSASARAREHGRVVARLFIDEAGLPRDVSVYQSSGFIRLDDAWAAAVRKARFKPPTLNGQPISGWALAAFDFQL